MTYAVFIACLFLALLLQLLKGDFPVGLFSFPLNAVLFVLWAFLVAMIWRKGKSTGFLRFMLSPGATYSATGLFLALCLVIGFTGYRRLVCTWPVVFLMLYFQTVLAFVILR